ncbi:hypothetical protein PU630_09520 [Microbacterium horticulturae]|uniref:Major facilitator superfamily (MFS) profile domain-containing protein n=1 Tax=Microbacterium horticulturae TaxID=3028316 RepID=A0ABY8BVF4_9MICO|nr:hypothetical protein [Microbacterium sp. KACC 23027]WEG07502.1 hypothetical protein PU630_09520 [Microbacterium sp. KACC 23027]
MQIVLALIFGGAVGALAHFTVGARDSRGAALGPMVGAVVGAGVWAALTWTGLEATNAWLWIASLGAPIVVVSVLLPLLAKLRAAHDQRRREQLGIA